MKKTRWSRSIHGDSEADGVRRFEQKFSEWMHEHTVSVFRVEESDEPRTRRKKLEFLGRFALDFVDEDTIQRRFGGGTYVLKLLDSRGRWRSQVTIRIATPIGQ